MLLSKLCSTINSGATSRLTSRSSHLTAAASSFKYRPSSFLQPSTTASARSFSATVASEGEEIEDEEEAETMEYDVLIVGGGPAGKSTIIHQPKIINFVNLNRTNTW